MALTADSILHKIFDLSYFSDIYRKAWEKKSIGLQVSNVSQLTSEACQTERNTENSFLLTWAAQTFALLSWSWCPTRNSWWITKYIQFHMRSWQVCKVHIFWEGHKILQHLHRRFVLCSASQIYRGDFTKFGGLLRRYELYYVHNRDVTAGKI